MKIKTCKRCNEDYNVLRPLAFRYGELNHKTCSCGNTYSYKSKVKFIDLKNGHIRMEMPN